MRPSRPKLKRVRPLLGTFVEIELAGHVPVESLHAWISAGFEAVEEIDRLMSFYRADSDVSRLNQAKPSVRVSIHPHTIKVLKAAEKLRKESNGFFNVRCREGLLDLGGIAKGYAVDCAVEKIKTLSRGYGVWGVVNAGGDLRRWGRGQMSVAVATSAVRTPGNQERLSPAIHIRMPAAEALTQEHAVTVLSEKCLWSDALTKVMMLAPKRVADSCLKRYHAHGLVLA